jgi:hypothetical protein
MLGSSTISFGSDWGALTVTTDPTKPARAGVPKGHRIEGIVFALFSFVQSIKVFEKN